MKKLRFSNEEKERMINKIVNKLRASDKMPLEAFNIDDIKKEFSKVPSNVVKPKLYITVEAYIKMLELVNQSPVECAWHGLVKRDREKNEYLIYDVLVFPQINSATSTTTNEDEFAKWQMNLIMDPDFPIEDLRMHGHSHVNMNVFSSGIDDKYQEDLLTKVNNGDYYIFLIMNKKMEICIFIYDFDQQVMFDKNDIDFEITTPKLDIRAWAKDQLKENAKTSFATTRPKYYYDEEETYTIFGTKTSPIFKGRR